MPEITLRDPCDIEAAERALVDLNNCREHLLAAVQCARLAAVDLDGLDRLARDVEREVDMTIADTCIAETIAEIQQAMDAPLPVGKRRVGCPT